VATPITVSQAAVDLRVTRARVLQLINAGRLPAQKLGMQYLIDRKDLGKVRVRKPGRPKRMK
jgi:excisionase family DNA binding protein